MSQKNYDVAAYIWPAYTGDEPRTRIFWPEGMGEWQTVKAAEAGFPGHQWPRHPRWGYVNEADSRVMEMQIDAAADYGVNVFIYDWYWYDRRPFLEQCLNEGYLKARNNQRVMFYLMWANHDATHIWDRRLANCNSDSAQDDIVWKGSVDRHEFEYIARRLIKQYFLHPSYYCIDGKPVFMIYELQNLIDGLGGFEATNDAFRWFRGEAVASGLPGLHLQLAYCGPGARLNLSGVDKGGRLDADSALAKLDFDSVTNYQFIHFINDIDRDYSEIMTDVVKEWRRIDEVCPKPYFPHVSIGWDNNPRFQEFIGGVMKNNTPDAFRAALEHARAFADAHPEQPPLITINSWNEWTESSYLQPDDLYGYGYLEAVKSVFGRYQQKQGEKDIERATKQ
jgi:hypothetical protein